ncbi:hypothetical protein Acsp05_69880 [Actinokineospora sp. NBRC 105648]|nr:hypothetical protein Acsp05_69880 [Actinokineospora sp. NBRC 105648]
MLGTNTYTCAITEDRAGWRRKEMPPPQQVTLRSTCGEKPPVFTTAAYPAVTTTVHIAHSDWPNESVVYHTAWWLVY